MRVRGSPEAVPGIRVNRVVKVSSAARTNGQIDERGELGEERRRAAPDPSVARLHSCLLHRTMSRRRDKCPDQHKQERAGWRSPWEKHEARKFDLLPPSVAHSHPSRPPVASEDQACSTPNGRRLTIVAVCSQSFIETRRMLHTQTSTARPPASAGPDAFSLSRGATRVLFTIR